MTKWMQGHSISTNHILVLMLLIAINGCSTRSKPAPVVDVQGSLPLSQRLKNSVTGSEYIVKKASKPSANNTNSKSRTSSKQKVIKKPIAQKKKQEYGGNVAEQKVSKKAQSQGTAFSQKIRKWRWPAKGKVIHKFSTAKQGNKGIDIAGRRGDSVKATADGKVVYAGDALQGYGQLVIVKHNEDYLSAYAHNDRILVKEQQVVKAGQVIARMGDTDAERVMLHFEVRFRGKSVNPMKYLPKQ